MRTLAGDKDVGALPGQVGVPERLQRGGQVGAVFARPPALVRGQVSFATWRPCAPGPPRRCVRAVREEGAVGVAAINDINEPALATARLAVQLLAAEVQLLQGDEAEPMLFADLLEGGLFFGRGAFGDFGGGRVGEAHGQSAPGMGGAARLQQEGSLDEALPQHEVDLEGGT